MDDVKGVRGGRSEATVLSGKRATTAKRTEQIVARAKAKRAANRKRSEKISADASERRSNAPPATVSKARTEKWKKDSEAFHERAEKKAKHEGYRSAEARSFHLREKRRAYVHQQGRGLNHPGLGARGRGGVRRRMPRDGGRRQRRIDDKYYKEAGSTTYAAPPGGFLGDYIDPRRRGRGGGGGGAQFSVPAAVRQSAQQVQSNFGGVTVDHNINHQNLNITGGDGIGGAIIQQILPQIIDLIKNITRQLINNSEPNTTGQLRSR